MTRERARHVDSVRMKPSSTRLSSARMAGMTDGETSDPSEIVRRYVDDSDDGGESLKKWAVHLSAYFDEQGPDVEVWRRAEPGHRPYPAPDNPAFGYLIERAYEISEIEGSTAAMIWLGAHAWFEGGLAEMAVTQAAD